MEHINKLSFTILDEFGVDFLGKFENTEIYSTLYRNPEETKWIAVSSIFFGIPGIMYFYKYFKKEHPFIKPIMIYSSLLIISSVFSVIYWIDARRGWRRNVDLIVSKITFATACICAVFYVNYSHFYTIALYSLFPFYVLTYTYSTLLIEKQDTKWVIYHVAFHILLAIGAISVLRGMEINN